MENGLLARRVILEVYVGVFYARLLKINDTACWGLPVSLSGSIKTQLVMSTYGNDVGL